MKYYVYILMSEKTGSFYIGQTENLEARIVRHNGGYERYTKKGVPWRLLWSTEKPDRSSSLLLEKKLKHLTRKRLVDFMIKYKDDIASPDELLFIKQLSGC